MATGQTAHASVAFDHTHDEPARDKRSKRGAAGIGAPSAREVYAGLAVLTVLACVTLMRGGAPVQTMAAAPGADAPRLEAPRAGEASGVAEARSTLSQTADSSDRSLRSAAR